MAAKKPRPDKIVRTQGYCALCWSSCGCVSVVEDDKLVAVEPDPTHPTGKTLCGKGLAAPEYVNSDARQLYPLKRTNPKGAADPGWQRISWDEALDTVAEKLHTAKQSHGAESVAFSVTTSTGTAIQDAYPFVERLRFAYGSPNMIASVELCNFSREFMHQHTFGCGTPVADVENSDCIVLWGHNPGTSWIALATRVADAVKRGAKLVVMDPVRVGFAAKADQWMQVRPGSDGALALSMAHVVIKEKLYNAEFVRNWTNAPFLVCTDTGHFLTAADISSDGDKNQLVVVDENSGALAYYDRVTGVYHDEGVTPQLVVNQSVEGEQGSIAVASAFHLYAELCASYPPEKAAEITWVSAEQIAASARLIGQSNAVSCSPWAGLEMHTNTSQTGRAIACFYALTGSFDAPGGNVQYAKVPSRAVYGREFLSKEQRKKTVGLSDRPLGPESIFSWITTDAFYEAILNEEPYPISTFVSFGMNILLSHADGDRGAKALEQLDFMAHVDLFLTPTAQYADIFLPVNTPWERDAVKTDFYVDQRSSNHVQYKPQVIPSRGESRSDAWITFELAKRLGYNDKFWDGDLDSAYREMLAPSGIDLDELKQSLGGVSYQQATAYQKYKSEHDGRPIGFATPTKKAEIYSEKLLQHGYTPLPDYVEPMMGPVKRPDLSEEFPLILTDTKSPHYIHSQFRHVAKLRRHEKEPRIDIHPTAAEARDINDGDWIELATPHAKMRVRANFVESVDPRVVRATAGWWQACEARDLPAYPANSDQGANFNRLIDNEISDPIGGCTAHKSYLCEVRPA